MMLKTEVPPGRSGGRRCGRCSTWTLPFLAGSHFTGCKSRKPSMAAFGICRGAGRRVFEPGCAALPQPLLLRSSLYTSFPSLLASLLPSRPSASGAKTSSSGCGPGLSAGRALALALAPTPGCACALLQPGPILMLKLKLLAQVQGFGHHLPSLPSAKLLALASRWSLLLALADRWPLLLAPTSRRSIPTRQFASTSPQSSWTI
jgi:hypothetical protein